jgi:hypothetical protein
MAENRRNGPCPCGSGSIAKHCCFAIHLLPTELSKELVRDLKGIDEVELSWLVGELPYLPEMDPALQTDLGIPAPEMGPCRLCASKW